MKAVVVHRGARDLYQVALGLHEAGMLDSLVTDFCVPAGIAARKSANRLLSGMADAVRLRASCRLPRDKVEMCYGPGLLSLAAAKAPFIPFGIKRRAIRWTDSYLGRHAGRIASRREALLLSYSYYGYSAFSSFSKTQPSILFQLHPHPSTVRRILLAECSQNPDCTSSLEREWELALPHADLQRLIIETAMPQYWIAASSFTKSTLVENGCPADRIYITPYGTDTSVFTPSSVAPGRLGIDRPLKVLFVGSITQRKGISYLLEAINAFPPSTVALSVCGRVVDDLKMVETYRGRVDIKPNLSLPALVAEYQAADVFVFPSLAEGFGHVILEALACGVPVVSTTATAAPDIVTNAVQGFTVEPGRVDHLVQMIGWFVQHSDRLAQMRQAARARAEEFTWAVFRRRVADVVRQISSTTAAAREWKHV